MLARVKSDLILSLADTGRRVTMHRPERRGFLSSLNSHTASNSDRINDLPPTSITQHVENAVVVRLDLDHNSLNKTTTRMTTMRIAMRAPTVTRQPPSGWAER